MGGVLGLAAIGAIAGGDTDPKGAQDIAVQPGVCFDGVTYSADEGIYSFGSLEEVSCARPHEAEVYYVLTEAQARTANASEAAFNAVSREVCLEEFAPYVGTSLARSGFAYASLGPRELGPSSAGEEIGCVLTDPNGPLTGTARGSQTPTGDASAEDTSVEDLAEGDCVSGLSPESVAFAAEVVDCSDPHEGEVFGAFDVVGDEYPDDLESVAGERCIELFDAYVGKTFEESILNLFPLSPSPSSWEIGDREVLCVLIDLEGKPLTGSMKGAGV